MIDGSANVSAPNAAETGLVLVGTGAAVAAVSAVVPAAMAATVRAAASSRFGGTGGSPLESTAEQDHVPRCRRQRGTADTVDDLGGVDGPGLNPVRVVRRGHGGTVLVVQSKVPDNLPGHRNFQVDLVGLAPVHDEDRRLPGVLVVRRCAPQRRDPA